MSSYSRLHSDGLCYPSRPGEGLEQRKDELQVSEPRCYCSSIRLSRSLSEPHSRIGSCSFEVIVNSCRGQLQRTHPLHWGHWWVPPHPHPRHFNVAFVYFSPGPCCIRIYVHMYVHTVQYIHTHTHTLSRPTQPRRSPHQCQGALGAQAKAKRQWVVRAPMSSSRPNGKKWTAGA